MCQGHGESDGRADGVVRKGSDPFFFFLKSFLFWNISSLHESRESDTMNKAS